MDILGYVTAFLGGGFLTAMLFVVGYSNKVATIDTRLTNLERKPPPAFCSYHQTLCEHVAVLQSQTGRNNK